MTPESAILSLLAELRQRVDAQDIQIAQLMEALDDAVAKTREENHGDQS